MGYSIWGFSNGIRYIAIEKQWFAQDNERRRLEVEARQDTERWEQHNRRKAENHRKEENQREEQNQRKMKIQRKEDNRREEEKDRQERRKKAFVSRVRQRSGGMIGLLNNTGKSITFTSTRFLMERSQVQSRLGEK